MNRIHCSLKELDKVLKDKTSDEVYSTIKQDESGMYLFTMTDGKQYITQLTPPQINPPKFQSSN